MKKLHMIAVLVVFGTACVFADKIISADALPKNAQTLIGTAFPGKTVQYAQADFNEYEAVLNDGTEIQFTGNGDWEEIKSYGGIPAALLPKAAADYIGTQYPNVLIVKAEKDWQALEVTLANRMELYFDKNGKLLGQKLDD
ncbi:PepSY-like domain-containing protein [Treponema brennaborense]|uniref:Periplasmic protein n=1 Tax=Treponema brennaborense (strain DSM 12168 / CIP 105900 / DD5/3) TaxID=906968 RepID=F4LPW3_TREBD|nr:PepSY-like domain-containing protein [Treponema brennaborense]AEE16055.1 periplasmic protein [Treponema brennaborense DSM 12168]